MRFEDLVVGMEVVANKGSNREYTWTNKQLGFVGKVVEIDNSDNTFKVEATQHRNSERIGSTAWVKAEYFDAKNIIVALKGEEREELIPAVGDMLVLENGKIVLVCRDYDGCDYRGVIVNDLKVTDYYGSVRRLMANIEDRVGKPVRIIRKSNIKISEI